MTGDRGRNHARETGGAREHRVGGHTSGVHTPGEHTPIELTREFDQLAARRHDDAAVRSTLDSRLERRAQRKRTTSWVAIVAAVVLLAGGIGISRTLFTNANGVHSASPGPGRASGTAHESGTAQRGEQGDAGLVPHQAQPVTSPVSATPPDGLTIRRWFSGPGQLRVSWFRDDLGEGSDSSGDGNHRSDGGGAARSRELSQASYAITDSKALHLQGFATGFAPSGLGADVGGTLMTIGGHDTTVTLHRFESSAGQGRVTSAVARWQLPGGKWIHVWVASGEASDDAGVAGAAEGRAASSTDTADSSGAAGAEASNSGRGTDTAGTDTAGPNTAQLSSLAHAKAGARQARTRATLLDALVHFAGSITEEPETLPRTMGIGLALPGLTTEWSMATTSPWRAKMSRAIGYAAIALCPDGVDPAAQNNRHRRCATTVIAHDSQMIRTAQHAHDVTIDGSTVLVEPDNQTAATVLERGSDRAAATGGAPIITVHVPESAHLSAHDLATLTASVYCRPASRC